MVEVVASSFLGMVFDKLGSIAIEKLQSLRGVGEELEKLKRTLSKIKDVLEDAEARQVEEKVIVRWLKDLKDVAYDIDDVLDVVVAEARKPNPLKRTHGEMVSKFLSFPKSLQFRHEIAKKIKEIREKLDFTSKEKDQYNLMSKGAAEHHPESEVNINGPRVTTSYVDKSQVVGRNTAKDAIINFLLNECNEQKLGVISIVGLGGVGKTTLAQLVYNDAAKHFNTNKIWVHVSEKFNRHKIITEIIETLKPEKFELGLELAEQTLLKQIEGRRFLLVLDDVWEEDYQKLETLGSLLKNGAKGSKLIVTTRSTRVASMMMSDLTYPLDRLSDDECRKLFETIAFGKDGADGNNRNLVAIGEEIVKKCRGLPLAAKALGSLMRFKKDQSQWEAIRDSEIWTLSEDDDNNIKILPALKLSYNHLSSRLKQCFAFCSIFPKGMAIQIKMLIQLWVAEGFVVDSSQGSECVEHLISRSLLEKRNEAVIKMHDLVHDLARLVAGDECSIVYTSESNTNALHNSRYASLIIDDVTPSNTQILSNGQKLRTFHLIRLGGDIHHQQLLDTIVSNVKLVRSLHLLGLSIKEMPDEIEKLVHLRYLNLERTKHKSLPETIGKLFYLQHLDLSYTYLQTLPLTVDTLCNLQILILHSCFQLKELPESIGDLVNLRTLNLSFCHNLKFLPDRMDKLAHLQHLDLSWMINLQTLPPTINTLHNLQTLNLSGCEKLERLFGSIVGLTNLLNLNLSYNHNIEVLPQTIDSLNNLQTLDLSYCCKLKALSESIGGLTNLLVLDLSRCHSIQTLPPLGTLHNLQTLILDSCYKLEQLPESIGDNLQRLDLRYCYSLQELPKNIQSMRSLTRLEIDECDNLTSMPKGIGQLSKLQRVSMYLLGDGENSASLAEVGTLMNLEGHLHIKHIQNVKDVAEAIAANLRKKQSIDSLALEWDFDAAGRKIRIESTDDLLICLESIDEFKKERKAFIETRVAAMDAEHVKLLEDALSSLQPHQNLRRLEIKSYLGKKLPEWTRDLSNLVKLRLESVARCDNLEALENLSRLEDLELYRIPFLKCLPRLGQLPRLEVLTLYMLPDVKRLGPELYGGAGAFPALEYLKLQYMLGLEEWSENANYKGGNDFLPHLSYLELRNCPKLKSLPSTFPSVEYLEIDAMIWSYIDDEFPNLNDVDVCKHCIHCIDTEGEDEDEDGAFPNLMYVCVHCIDTEEEEEEEEEDWYQLELQMNRLDEWYRLELEKVRLETLKKIAEEIENKTGIRRPPPPPPPPPPFSTYI